MAYHIELKKLFGDNQDIVNDVNKLFYSDARITVEKKGNIQLSHYIRIRSISIPLSLFQR